MYQQVQDSITGSVSMVKRLADKVLIPFDAANTDYRKFKTEAMLGAQIKNTSGITMTAAQISEFLSTIP